MDPRNVGRILGRLNLERGRDNEARVLAACTLDARPAWMVRARKATAAEDRDGIDIVIESDVGKLFLQVKSSRLGKSHFEQKRRRATVSVIIASAADTPEAILGRVVAALRPVRAAHLSERAGR
jgi:hypothetical protein